ncbi:hypothetical protein LBMAG21_17520 [Armatimonadota bacterium]|nr:hypothetical protein LBMAG21_17520 [Armatimonadota bacterium]
MSLDFFEALAERQVQDAVEEGAFDNLPGKGKPLRFENLTGIPYAELIANRILKNAGVLPEWVQAQKDLEAEISTLLAQRTKLIEDNLKRQAQIVYLPTDHISVNKYRLWHKQSRDNFHKKMKRINGLILKLNLTAPSTIRLPGLHKVDEEMEAFDEEFQPVAEGKLVPRGSQSE